MSPGYHEYFWNSNGFSTEGGDRKMPYCSYYIKQNGVKVVLNDPDDDTWMVSGICSQEDFDSFDMESLPEAKKEQIYRSCHSGNRVYLSRLLNAIPDVAFTIYETENKDVCFFGISPGSISKKTKFHDNLTLVYDMDEIDLLEKQLKHLYGKDVNIMEEAANLFDFRLN